MRGVEREQGACATNKTASRKQRAGRIRDGNSEHDLESSARTGNGDYAFNLHWERLSRPYNANPVISKRTMHAGNSVFGHVKGNTAGAGHWTEF